MLSKIYDIKNLKGDFTGGLVAGVVALPLALAFGVQGVYDVRSCPTLDWWSNFGKILFVIIE